jgi:hypothetical protein
LRNTSRDRRVLFFLLLVAGCMMGAFLRLKIGSANSVVVSVAIKVVAHTAVLFARVEEDGEVDETSGDENDIPL